MQGIFILGRRPKSKKEIRELVEAYNDTDDDGYGLVFEATSMFGDEYDGSLANMPRTEKISFVGPDPYKKRNFYGTVEWSEKKEAWVVR